MASHTARFLIRFRLPPTNLPHHVKGVIEALANQACFTLNERCGEVAERPKALGC